MILKKTTKKLSEKLSRNYSIYLVIIISHSIPELRNPGD